MLVAAICCTQMATCVEAKAKMAPQETNAVTDRETRAAGDREIKVTATGKGMLSFHITYIKEETMRGELYQYSERYLGTSDVIKEDGTTYKLTGIQVNQSHDSSKSTISKAKAENSNKKSFKMPAPLNEETLTATNTAKKAEGVAKQIYRLREARVNIVSGEAEHAPADGMAMETSLRELKEMERQLTELFIGSKRAANQHVYIRYELEESLEPESEVVLMRFSKHEGPVDADDLSGEPVYLKITRTIGPKEDEGKKKKKNEKAEQEVKEMKITVEYDGHKLLERKLKR